MQFSRAFQSAVGKGKQRLSSKRPSWSSTSQSRNLKPGIFSLDAVASRL